MAEAPTRFISSGRKDGAAVDLLNRTFEDAARRGASDVHFDDTDDGQTLIRFRIGGLLEDIEKIDRQLMLMCDSKIRAFCQLSLQERMIPLDGRMFIDVDGGMVDMRVSIMPSRTGQSIVCRLLDQKNAARTLQSVEMTDEVRFALDEVLKEPNGLVVTSGPTGSGKTSTLYAMLNALNTPEVNIITVEDPVEYRLDRATQVQVSEKLSFAMALRSTLRQDPDIILVGEIRDAETARIAVEAAMTGHLVLATTHANDTSTTLTRLVDLGVDPFTLGAVLRAGLAQRLAPRLCECCVRPHELTRLEQDWLQDFAPEHAAAQFYTADGCDACDHKGSKGRLPVFEMVVGDHEVRLAVQKNSRADMIAAAHRQPQFETLIEAGLRLAVAGQISLHEARRLSSNIDRSTQRTGTVPSASLVSSGHAASSTVVHLEAAA